MTCLTEQGNELIRDGLADAVQFGAGCPGCAESLQLTCCSVPIPGACMHARDEGCDDDVDSIGSIARFRRHFAEILTNRTEMVR